MFGFFGVFEKEMEVSSGYDSTEYLEMVADYSSNKRLLVDTFKAGKSIEFCQFGLKDQFDRAFESDDLFVAGRCRFDNLSSLYSALGISTHENDLELLSIAYNKWGESCLEHLIGDFSFAIWDKKRQTLILAKDQMGIRPLFYAEQKGFIYFASSLPLLKELLPGKPDLNLEYIAKELKNFPQKVEDTFFIGINRLKPAHFLRINRDNELVEERYWELSQLDIPSDLSDEDFYEMLRNRLTEAIRCRIRGHQTIGCQMSGGMDSSAIAVILSRIMDKKQLHTYSFVLNEKTAAYSENGIDEKGTQKTILDYAELIRDNHHQVEEFHYETVFEEFDNRNRVMGGLANSDALWQDSMFKLSSEHNVSVMFSGFPGDEGISNHGGRYYYEYLHEKNITGILSHLYYFKFSGIRNFAGCLSARFSGSDRSIKKFRPAKKKRSILDRNSRFQDELGDLDKEFEPSYRQYIKDRVCRSHTTLRTESEGAYAIHHGVETVYPLADIRLLQLVYSLPIHLFRPKPFTRALFRNLTKGILPDEVRLQPKRSGAFTLAFADYWTQSSAEELKSYKVRNHTGLLAHENELYKLDPKLKLLEAARIVSLKRADYLIGLNWPGE